MIELREVSKTVTSGTEPLTILHPLDYTIASMADKVIGWGLVGLALAAIVRPCQAREAAA